MKRLLPLALMCVMLTGCLGTFKLVKPPDELLKDCPAVSRIYETNRDLVDGIIDYREALKLCDADKKALRLWYEKAERKM